MRKDGFYFMIDYAFKSKVLNEEQDLIKRYKKARLNEYCKALYVNDGVITKTLENAFNSESFNDLEFWCFLNHKLEELNEIEKLDKSGRSRTRRLNKRVKKILLNGDAIFLTFTFNDNTLSSTSKETRRRYVSYYLKQYSNSYVANIDYGKKNGREHYHALVSASKVPCEPWRKYGDIDFERVRNRSIETDIKRLSKYISKLTNHAIKETTKRSCLLYSR